LAVKYSRATPPYLPLIGLGRIFDVRSQPFSNIIFFRLFAHESESFRPRISPPKNEEEPQSLVWYTPFSTGLVFFPMIRGVDTPTEPHFKGRRPRQPMSPGSLRIFYSPPEKLDWLLQTVGPPGGHNRILGKIYSPSRLFPGA